MADAESAPAVAEQLGFPVALKLVRPGLAHKTEAGAVRLGLTSAQEVRQAVAEMPAGPLLVERMAGQAVAEL